MIGPLPLTTSNSIPMAGNGVKISLNMMTPSGLKALQGCKDSSKAISAVSLLFLKPNLSEYLQDRLYHIMIAYALDRLISYYQT